jgi:hypothetical protein
MSGEMQYPKKCFDERLRFYMLDTAVPYRPGMPDGLYSKQKSQFASEGIILENVDIFYGHLEYFTEIWDILRKFGIFYENVGYFMVILYILCSFNTFLRFW